MKHLKLAFDGFWLKMVKILPFLLQTLEQSTKIVEKNSGKLKTESDRLDEINKKRCSWGIWIMLVIVCIVFINMIIFIKFFPKRKR